jgi:ribosomal protein S7
MKNGKKRTSEKIFLQNFKELQKHSSKETKKLIKVALINATPIFKIHKITNKKVKKKKSKITKEIPSFITNEQSRVSQAIKFILEAVKKKPENFYKKFSKELLLNSQNLGNAVEKKNEVQKHAVVIHNRYLKFYRWR